MAQLVDAPWDNAKTSASNDDDLFERIGAMSIKDLKKFLGERNVTPDASIVEKRELRNLAYQSAGVGPPAKPLPAGWAKFVDPSDGTPYYHCRATGETSWDFPEAPAAEAPARDRGRHDLGLLVLGLARRRRLYRLLVFGFARRRRLHFLLSVD